MTIRRPPWLQRKRQRTVRGEARFNPRDVLDAAITAWKARALTLNTWRM
jgi:hypothetical protein